MGEKLKIPDSPFIPDGGGLPEFEISSMIVGGNQAPLPYENGLANSEIYGQCDSEVAGQCHNGVQKIAPVGSDGANLPTLEVTSILTGEPPTVNEMQKSEIYGDCDSEIVGNCY